MDSDRESPYFPSNSPHHEMPLLQSYSRSTSPANSRPKMDGNSLNKPVRPSPPSAPKPQLADPSDKKGYILTNLYSPTDLHNKLQLDNPKQEDLSKTATASLSTLAEAERQKRSKREKCWRGMMICQFVMVLLIFLFILALSIGIGYIALTVKDAVDRADHAIHNNPVTNFVDRIKSLKTSVSQSVQKMKGKTQA